LPHNTISPLARWSREHWALAGLCASLGVLVITIIPGFASAMRGQHDGAIRTTLSLPLPPLAGKAASAAAGSAWQVVQVQSGQTLGTLFEQMGVPASVMHQVLELPSARPLSRLRAGAEIAFDLGQGGELRGLRFERDEASRIEL
jgi:Opacity-associated protein A LysM-like domain